MAGIVIRFSSDGRGGGANIGGPRRGLPALVSPAARVDAANAVLRQLVELERTGRIKGVTR